MAFTQADVDLLKAAISAGRGVRTLTFADQSVSFHSVEDMLRLLAAMQQDVAADTGVSLTRYAAVRKGV